MIRVDIAQIVLCLRPCIGYVLFRVVTGGDTSPFASRTVTFSLTLAGSALVLCGFVYLAVTGGTSAATYVPTQYIDGELVPGGFRPAEEAQ